MSDEIHTPTEFSKYGLYEIDETLSLNFPDTEIKFEKISSKVFSYYRLNSEGKTVEKIIPLKSEILKIEVSPIRPLNHPARRTSHMFLQFDKDVFLPENSAATVFVRCPIEIGMFIVHDGHKDSLDWFTCDPLNSRFGLYGSPDTGILCKYSKTPIVGSHNDSVPYYNGVMKVIVKNELSGGHSLGKVVFPITDNAIYYDGDQAIFDGLVAVLKKRGRSDIIDINEEKIETTWSQSPTWEATTAKTQMEMGLD